MFPYLKSKHIHIKYRGFLIKETSVKKGEDFYGRIVLRYTRHIILRSTCY